MIDLKTHFITVDRPYKEGTVEVFEQTIGAMDVKRAALTITALGVYEAEINGKKVGDIFLAPGYTYYPRDLHVQVLRQQDADLRRETRRVLGTGGGALRWRNAGFCLR